MPILVLAMIWLVLSPGLVEWQAPVLWTRQIGRADSMAADSSYVYVSGHVIVASNHRVYPYCYYNNTGGTSYYFLDKYDRYGNLMWSQHFGSPGACEFAAATAVTDGAVYLAVTVNRISLLRKYDGNGNFQWSRQFGNLSDFTWEVTHVVPAPYLASVSAAGGRVFIAGTAFLNGTYVGEVGGYDSDGKLIWTSNLGSDAYFDPRPVPYPLAVYADSGSVYLAINLNNGSYLRKLDLNGVIQWSHSSGDPIDGVSGFAESVYTVAKPPSEVVLKKLDPSGNVLWSVRSKGPDGLDVRMDTTISVSSSGEYLTENGFVVKYDGNGNRIWYVNKPLQAQAIAANSEGVYVGDGLSLGIVSASKSLIMFGIGPPYSFIIVAGLGGVVGIVLLVFRFRKKMRRPGNANHMRYGQPQIMGLNRESVPSAADILIQGRTPRRSIVRRINLC